MANLCQKNFGVHGFVIIESAKVANYASKEATLAINKIVEESHGLLSILKRNKALHKFSGRNRINRKIVNNFKLTNFHT